MPKGLVYTARTAAGSDAGLPTGWPYGWQYPGVLGCPYPTAFDGTNITGIHWPTNWPIAVVANTVVVCDSPASLATTGSGSGTVETYIEIGGSETAASVYANHLLLITATHNGNVVNVRGPNDLTAGSGACIKVTNYAGNRWGGSGTFTFSISGLDPGIDLIVRGRLITVTAVASDTDNTDLTYS